MLLSFAFACDTRTSELGASCSCRRNSSHERHSPLPVTGLGEILANLCGHHLPVAGSLEQRFLGKFDRPHDADILIGFALDRGPKNASHSTTAVIFISHA